MSAALVVLMRWPRRGEGKTRLAARLGTGPAHALHRAFVADTLAWPSPRPRLLAVSPDGAAVTAVRARLAASGAVVVPQACGDLGTRIAAALQAALESHGVDRAVIVGTDSPSLPHRLLLACLDGTGDGGACLVPAVDGGFVALAVSRGGAQRHGLDWLRDGIAWSSERTCAHTVAAAARAGLAVRSTTPWYDVDEVDDLSRLHTDLRCDPGRAPRTLRCLDRLGMAAVELAS